AAQFSRRVGRLPRGRLLVGHDGRGQPVPRRRAGRPPGCPRGRARDRGRAGGAGRPPRAGTARDGESTNRGPALDRSAGLLDPASSTAGSVGSGAARGHRARLAFGREVLAMSPFPLLRIAVMALLLVPLAVTASFAQDPTPKTHHSVDHSAATTTTEGAV